MYPQMRTSPEFERYNLRILPQLRLGNLMALINVMDSMLCYQCRLSQYLRQDHQTYAPQLSNLTPSFLQLKCQSAHSTSCATQLTIAESIVAELQRAHSQQTRGCRLLLLPPPALGASAEASRLPNCENFPAARTSHLYVYIHPYITM